MLLGALRRNNAARGRGKKFCRSHPTAHGVTGRRELRSSRGNYKPSSIVPAQEKIQLGPERQTTPRRAIGAKQRQNVRIRKDVTRTGVVYDARGEHLFFPVPEVTREFRDAKALIDNIAAETNGKIVPGRSGARFVSTRAVQVGASYWVDPRSKLIYRVRQPLLASIGGVSGFVKVAGRTECIDPDGTCSSGVASYLQPVLRTAGAPLNVSGCQSLGDASRCVEYTSFFNRVPLVFFNWARHGGNSRLTSGSAGERSAATSC